MARIPPPKIAAANEWNALQTDSDVKGRNYAIFIGDSMTRLKSIPSRIVNTCLTSPPYWSARDYEHSSQIGLEETIEEYISKLVAVLREVRRTLVDDGTMWLNLGDCYLHNSRIGTGGRNTRWQKNKQLALIPFRVAMALQEDGWILRNTVVWQKPNAMPASVRDRLTNVWEPIFLFSKSEQYFFNLDGIRVAHKTDDEIERIRAEKNSVDGKAKGKAELREWLNSPRHRSTIEGLREIKRRPNAPDPTELAAYLRLAAQEKNLSLKTIAGVLQQPFERIRHYFRTDKIGSRLPPQLTWEALKDLLDLGTEFDDAMAIEVGDNVFRNHPNGRNPGDFVSLSIKGNADGHFAVMPLTLAQWTLASTLPNNGVCLDPFMGVGTTGKATCERGGRFVGVDVREDFVCTFCRTMDDNALMFDIKTGDDSQPRGHRPMKANGRAISSPVSESTSRHTG